MDIDEDIEIGKNNVNDKLRQAVSSELTSYTNPQPIGETNIKITEKTPPQVTALNTEPALSLKQDRTTKISARPIVRTYKSDMEETIQAGHLSSINIAVSENNKMMKQMKQGNQETKKAKINKNIVIISLILIAGGAAVVFVPYFLVQKQNTTTVMATSTALAQAVMTTDIEEKINTKDINLNGIDITLKQRVDQSSTELGQVKDFVLTKGDGANESPITASEFLTLIKADVPPEIARNLLPQYMFGMHNFNGNQEFLILKVSSYDTTFSGMLSWETDLWQNFKNLFGLSDATLTGTTVPANSSTSSPSAPDSTGQSSFGIEVKKFQDAEFDNKNARVVKDASGNIIFLYSIINPSTIVITTNPGTLREIVSRTNRVSTVTQ